MQPEDTEVHMVGLEDMGSRPGGTQIMATKVLTTQATATKAIITHTKATAKATATAKDTQATEAITEYGPPLTLEGMAMLTLHPLVAAEVLPLELALLALLDLLALLALLVPLEFLDLLASLAPLALPDLPDLLAPLAPLAPLALLVHRVVQRLSEMPLRTEVSMSVAATFIGKLGPTRRPKHLDYGIIGFGEDIHGVYIWLTLIHGRHILLTASKAAE